MTAPASPYLVTGGAGFIGSHLVERLLLQNQKVIVIDDCSTGSRQNLAAVQQHPNLQFIHSTVSQCADLQAIAKNCQFIFHLAAAVGVDLVVRSPIQTIETNLRETEAILHAAAPAGTPLLLTSTSEVYGKSQQERFSEDDDLLIGPPLFGRWSYACSKLMDEFLALAFLHERHLPVIIARLFNTVGPRQTGRYGMVLPRFLKAALNNQPLPIHGTGEQTRCFCYVHDTVEALLRLRAAPAAVGQVVNVGSQQEVTITALARMVVECTSSKAPLQFIPYQQAYTAGFQDMLRRKPSLHKLQSLTGFTPATSLREIIHATAQALSEPGGQTDIPR